jgi:nucleoside-diphosphate-sugar epimerase
VVATGIGLPAARAAVVPESNSPPAARLAGPRAALRFVDKNVHTTIVCLPPVTHGPSDTHGFIPRLIATAREKKVSAFVGEGANRWPAVHVRDAARLFHLALEKLPAGAAVHAVADEGVPIRTIAEVISRHLGIPVASIPAADAPAHFGWMGALLARDSPSSGALARELLGWESTEPGLIADLEAGNYFR